MATDCLDCTSGGTYDLRCLQCAGRYLARVIRSERSAEADRLCARFGHDRTTLLAAYKAYRAGPVDGR